MRTGCSMRHPWRASASVQQRAEQGGRTGGGAEGGDDFGFSHAGQLRFSGPELTTTGANGKPGVLRILRLAMPGGSAILFSATKESFMADAANRYPDNIAGKYYVDNQCIDCDLCRETAPDNFKRSDDGGYSFVYKQPESPEEEARCKEAKEGCPVEAIGDNGA